MSTTVGGRVKIRRRGSNNGRPMILLASVRSEVLEHGGKGLEGAVLGHGFFITRDISAENCTAYRAGTT